MNIRLGKLQISIWAVIVFAAVLYSDFSVFTAEVILAAVIHELGHLAAIRLFKANIYSVVILPYGAVIYSDAALLPYKKEAVTSLAGIVLNLATGTASILIWLLTNDIYTLFFTVCSYFLAFVNLVPIPTLDGARALEAILCERYGDEKKDSIMDTVYYFSFLFLVIASLYVLNITDGNFSLVIFLACVFIGVYANKAEMEQ